MFHEPSAKIPLIVCDPRPEADAIRGTTCDALVEGIDLASTFIEAAGSTVPGHIIEGRALMPWLRGETPGEWRDSVVSEYGHSVTPMCAALGVTPADARLFMVYDGRWKTMHADGGFRPMLFDTETDDIRFVEPEDHTGEAVEKFLGRFRTLAEIPAHSYDRQVNETAVMSHDPNVGIGVRADLDAETVCRITGTFGENLDKITSDAPWAPAITIEAAVQDLGMSLHRGALRYCQEVGALQAEARARQRPPGGEPGGLLLRIGSSRGGNRLRMFLC